MKKTENTLLAVCLMGLVTIISCESEPVDEVNQDSIETNYTLIYEANIDQTTASATLKFGATYLRLSSPSELLFNGARLKEESFLGDVTYQKELNGVVAEGEFVYKNNDEETFVNVLRLSSVDVPRALKEISMSDLVLVSWIGDPIMTNERIGIRIWNDQTSYSTSIDDVNATTIQVRGADLSAELLGQCTIQMERIHQKNLDEAPEEGGVGVSKWLSHEYSIRVVE